MALELRRAAADVGPFGESLAPPGVVLRDRMELRQIEGDGLRQGLGRRGAGEGIARYLDVRLQRFFGRVRGTSSPSLLEARAGEMRERFHAHRGNVRMRGKIEPRVEPRIRLVTELPAVAEIMLQRVQATQDRFRMAAPIVLGVEQRMGVAAFPRAVGDVVFPRVHARLAHVRVDREVILGIEQFTRGGQPVFVLEDLGRRPGRLLFFAGDVQIQSRRFRRFQPRGRRACLAGCRQPRVRPVRGGRI